MIGHDERNDSGVKGDGSNPNHECTCAQLIHRMGSSGSSETISQSCIFITLHGGAADNSQQPSIPFSMACSALQRAAECNVLQHPAECRA